MSQGSTIRVPPNPPNTIRRSINGVQPAGQELIYTVPAGVMQRLLWMFIDFQTSSTVINRYPGYQVSDPSGNTGYQARLSTAWPASTELVCSMSPRAPVVIASLNPAATTLQFPDNWLWPGCKIQTLTYQLQSGDSYRKVNWFLEEIPITADLVIP